MMKWPSRATEPQFGENEMYRLGYNQALQDCKLAYAQREEANALAPLDEKEVYKVISNCPREYLPDFYSNIDWDKTDVMATKAICQKFGTKENVLVPLDLEEVVSVFPKEWPHYKCVIISERICQKFGATKDKGLSEEKHLVEPSSALKILIRLQDNIAKADKQQKLSGVYADYKTVDAFNQAVRELEDLYGGSGLSVEDIKAIITMEQRLFTPDTFIEFRHRVSTAIKSKMDGKI